MPELPEVETIVRELNENDLIGKKIAKALVFWPRTIAAQKTEDFCSKIALQSIIRIDRRGKFIVITLSNDTLLIHLRMTGKLTIANGIKEISSHERVRLHLNDGRIVCFEDQRKFGKWYLLSNADEKLNELGIEPLSKSFTLSSFKKLVSKSTQKIKPFLLDQKHIVGLGNIYVDEALWEAKVHPARKANSLTQKEILALHQSIPNVLRQGIAHMGTTLGSKAANYYSVSGRRGGHQTQLNVFRRDGLPCPRCRTVIAKMTLAQRGTHFCPHCQKI